jgi:hypothetical protein
MKKIIRLSESELVSLVKRTIMESNQTLKKLLKENRFDIYKSRHPFFYCEKSFSPIQVNEMNFCKASETIIREKKTFYSAFNEVVLAYFEEEKEDLFKIEVEKLTKDSEIVKKGFEELDEVERLIGNSCPRVKEIVKTEKNKFFEKIKLYYKTKNQNGEYEYSVINRLDTNYSALAVLITKYFSQRGAFDGVKNVTDWKDIALKWMYKLFRPSWEFIDLRPEEEKKDNPINPGMEDLIDSFFRERIAINTKEIRSLVEDIILDTRRRGFDSENMFEEFLIKEKKENKIQDYKRYAYDFGFVDMLLGIDFLIKENNEWYPVQVKSTANEQTYKIDMLKCSRAKTVEPTKYGIKNW